MYKSLSIVAYLGMMVGLLLLLETRNLFSPSEIVIIFQVAATVLMVWARITFGRRSFHVGANPTEGGVVMTGPYRLIRHPIYTGVCVFTLSGASAHRAWATAGMAALVVGCAVLRMFLEEKLLYARYPEYKQYTARTWRMVPLVF